jgi:hypothetical protein
MSYQGDYGDGQPPQYPQDYGRQYPQDKPWQPQENSPFAYGQNSGGQRGTDGQQQPQQVPPWPGVQGGQQQPNGQPSHPQFQRYPAQVPPGQQPPGMPPQPQPKRKSWPARHKVLTGLMAVGALIVIIAATSASNKPSTPVADTGAATSASPSAAASSAAASPSAAASSAAATPSAAASSAAASTAPSTPAAPASPAMTSAQQQAVDSAQSYLSEGQGFSEQGLLNQLTSSYGSGFAEPDAEFAIRYLSPNWDQQAVDSAQSYLSEGQGFSEQGLIQQLTSSAGNGFTQAQAEYAIDHVQADWDAQAVDAAKGYMQIGGFSRAGLIQQLTSSAGNGFTLAQAEYAVSKVGL